MRFTALGVFVAAALMTAAAPADAAWKSYISHRLGIAFAMPGEVRAEKGTYSNEVTGPQQTVIFKSVDDTIEYTATVIDFTQASAESATLLGIAEFDFQDNKKVLGDNDAHVGDGKNTVWGRKITIETPKAGRATSVFYFTKGHFYWLQANMLPAHSGDTTDLDRFVDSTAFQLGLAPKDAVELPLP